MRFTLLALSLVAIGCTGGTLSPTDPSRADLSIHLPPTTPESYGTATAYELKIRGDLLSERGQTQAAANLRENAVQADPNDPTLRTDYARTLLAQGKTQAAARQLSRALLLEPTDQQAWIALADLKLSQGNESQAVDAARAAIRLNPRGVAALWWLAKHHRANNDSDAAVEVLRQLVSIDPEHEDAHLALGELLKGAQAIDHLTIYVKLGGSDIRAYTTLATACNEASDPTSAVEILELAVRSHPAEGDLREQLISQLLDNQMPSRVAGHVLRLPRLTPGDTRGAIKRSTWLRSAGSPYQARQAIVDAQGPAPTDPATRLELAKVEIELERFENAAVLIDPNKIDWPTHLRADVKKIEHAVEEHLVKRTLTGKMLPL